MASNKRSAKCEVPHLPLSAPALLAMLSSSMPIVMRDGKAWGLMSRSGRMPVRAQYGISTSGHA